MESQALYRVSFVAVPPTATPPAATSLEAEVQALTTRLRLTATAAGLPDLAFSQLTVQRTQRQSFTTYSLTASTPHLEFHEAAVAVQASTLHAVEILFLEALAEYAYHHLDAVHEQEPALFGNQQLASYQALAREAA